MNASAPAPPAEVEGLVRPDPRQVPQLMGGPVARGRRGTLVAEFVQEQLEVVDHRRWPLPTVEREGACVAALMHPPSPSREVLASVGA